MARPGITITPHSVCCVGNIIELMASSSVPIEASAVWPTASTAFLFPFAISTPFVVATAFIYNGIAVAGNVDVGVYAPDGTRMMSTGLIAQAGTSSIQLLPLVGTIGAGSYYLAGVADNAAATVFRVSTTARYLRAAGTYNVASAAPLPASITFAAALTAFVPMFGIAQLVI